MRGHPDMPFDEDKQPASIEETLESIADSLKDMVEQSNRVIEMYDREHELLMQIIENASNQRELDDYKYFLDDQFQKT